jgi:hypothetical protein
VINPFLYDIAGFSVSPDTCKLSYLQQIEHEATASAGTISAFGAQSAQGTLWDVLRGFLDVGPWTELFIEDRPEVMDDPKRPAAWCWSIATTLQGSGPGEGLHHAPAHQAGHAGGRRRVGDELEIGRSDANVANYFQVNMPRMNLIDAATMNLSGQSTNPDDFYLDGYPNADPKLYGLRFMEADTQMGGADSLGRADGQSAEVVKREQRKSKLWIDERRAQLMAQNKDNVVFEDGSITLMGQCPCGRACTCGCGTGRGAAALRVGMLRGGGAAPHGAVSGLRDRGHLRARHDVRRAHPSRRRPGFGLPGGVESGRALG